MQFSATRAESADVQFVPEMDWIGASPHVGVPKVISPRDTVVVDWRGKRAAETATVANRAAMKVESWKVCIFGGK